MKTTNFFTRVTLAVALAAGIAFHSTVLADDATYSVSVLGDLHYDAQDPELYHGTNKAYYAGDEYRRNKAMWQEESPAILAASAKCAGPDTAFVLQLGDIIQGQTHTYAAHTQMLAAATSVLKETFPNLPVVTVVGNHDVLGRGGASKAYRDFMLPWLTKQIAPLTTNAVTRTTFGFRHGPDLWIFIDFNNGAGSVPAVKKLLAGNPDARYTFVATHGPVLPMDIWKRRWFYLGGANLDKERREMRALFAKRNAIVLSGHVHSLEYKDWYGDGGRITEMVLNSVPRYSKALGKKPAVPRVSFDTPESYGMWLTNAPKDQANIAFDALYEEYRPGLKARFASQAVGHHVLRVSDAGVTLEYYGRDATEPTKVFTLR